MGPELERKLAAILSADVVAYSRLMAEDEAGTIRTLGAYRTEITNLVSDHRGRVADFTGDNFLAELPTALDAVECAVEIQRVLRARNESLPEDRRMEFRIGVHLGDVAVEGERLYGDGVNIAARLEGLSEPGGVCVSGEVHGQVESKLALRYQDLGEQSVKNIPKPVRAYQLRLESAAADATAQTRRGPGALVVLGGVALLLLAGLLVWRLPTTTPSIAPGDEAFTVPGFGGAPAIAVLAFDNLSGDPEQDYFSDGIAEDLITRLSAWRRFPVIARTSSFTYKGRAVDVKQVSRELGVRYLVEGSVRKAGGRVRISAQLVDATTGHHVWAESYDRDLGDIFAVQDEITESIVRALRPELERTEMDRAARDPKVGAYDLTMRARWSVAKATPEDNAKARSLGEEAIELDHSYARAWALLALSHWLDLVMQWTDSPARSLRGLERAARRSIALDAGTAPSHLALARFYQATGQTEGQLAALEQAVNLDPSSSDAHRSLGSALAWMDRREEALRHLHLALRLDPMSPTRWVTLLYVSIVHWSAARYELALEHAQQAERVNRGNERVHRILAISYVGLGRLDEARAAIDEALRINPDQTLALAREQYRALNPDPQLVERWLAALRKAGLPE